MIWFTDSPYERMMVQLPTGQEKAPASSARPPSHPCCGCPYGREAPCLGVCYKKLLKGSGKHAACDC